MNLKELLLQLADEKLPATKIDSVLTLVRGLLLDPDAKVTAEDWMILANGLEEFRRICLLAGASLLLAQHGRL